MSSARSIGITELKSSSARSSRSGPQTCGLGREQRVEIMACPRLFDPVSHRALRGIADEVAVQVPVREETPMGYVSYTELRQNLKRHLDSVCDSRAPLVETRQNSCRHDIAGRI